MGHETGNEMDVAVGLSCLSWTCRSVTRRHGPTSLLTLSRLA